MDTTLRPPSDGGFVAVLQLIATFEPEQIGAAVDVLIERLDLLEGDPDIEVNGDELDGNGSEDDFMDHAAAGPGCPLADAAEEDDHGGAGDGLRDIDDSEAHPMESADTTQVRKHRDRIRRTRCVPLYETYRVWGEVSPRREIRSYRLCHDQPVPTWRSIRRRKRGMPPFPRP